MAGVRVYVRLLSDSSICGKVHLNYTANSIRDLVERRDKCLHQVFHLQKRTAHRSVHLMCKIFIL